MRLKLNTLLLGFAGLALPSVKAGAQVSILADYKNNHSAQIGTFQGINFREGGFSGIYPVAGTHGKEFWVCSDRGVNVDAANANPSGCTPTYDKIYSFPSYAPKIHRVRVNGDSVQIIQTISIKRPSGTTATGIINPTGFGSTATEVASTDTVQNCANFNAKTTAKDPWGIDAEGIAVDKDGYFWVCEEGGPTVWKLDQNGRAIMRYSPYANLVGAEPQDVLIDTVFKYRKNNRGFEGITIAPNGKIYAIIQSPILYPTKTVGENTRVHRILEIDPVTHATRMFAYLNDGIIGASGSNQIRLRDWKIGDLAAINDSTFLVIEAALRGTTDVKRVYKININGATAVHSGLYSGLTLEALVDAAGLSANGITPVQKTLFMDINAVGWNPALDKTEALAIVDDSTIFIGNDNDYGQFSPLENGIATATSNLCHILKYRLSGSSVLNNFTPVTSTLTQGITGPSTSKTPYLVPTTADGIFTSILTAGENVGTYKLCGLPDGMGAFDNGDGTFTALLNHEMNNAVGVNRVHGQKGAFVSKWIINKSDMRVISGSDLTQNAYVWNPLTSSYVNYNAAYSSSLIAFNRFCSADLPAVSAFYNSNTGKGTMERIFMNGEESGNEGRAFGHIVTGPAAGTTYELPRLGKFSWENSIASPIMSDTTVVIGLDDATPGQVYVYVGTKTNTGSDVEKAGLTNGKLYGVSVAGMVTESSAAFAAAGTPFSLIDMGNVQNMTGLALHNASNAAGVTSFLRPEDGVWDPKKPNDFYFVTTNSFTSPSRMWRLRFTNASNPALGGTVEAVLDGTEGPKMMDNIGIDNYGHIMIQEDPGGQTYLAKTWQYDIATDAIKLVASHDSTRFQPGGSQFLTIDEESSGIIDMEEILGPGMFLLADQAHYGISGEVVEGGQLLTFFNPDTYNAAPEVNVTGNTVTITDGDNTPSTADYTDMGNTFTGTASTKTFVIENHGAGTLTVNGINFSGANASEFTLSGASSFPWNIAANSTQTVTVSFMPMAAGSRNATITINTNDINESAYEFAIRGTGVDSPEVNIQGAGTDIVDGDMTPGVGNNTDFGTVNVGSATSNTFTVSNSGYGNLVISAINFTGTAAADFSLVGAPSLPFSISPGNTYTITAQFTPSTGGARPAVINVVSNDGDESTYNFAVSGIGNYLPEINVKGNGINIIDGDVTAGTLDNTNFGSVNTSASVTHNFRVYNTGMGALSVSGITFTGASAGDYSLVGAPSFPYTVAAGDSMTVSVKFAPMTGGLKYGTINIMSNDADEATYDFALEGLAIAIPEVSVEGSGIEIIDGDMTPGTANNTDFGSANMGSFIIKHFTIRNTGVGNLSLATIGFTGVAASEFSLAASPILPATIAPGDTAAISVQFAATTLGTRTATINIMSNDVDEATYNFALQAVTTGLPEINIQGDTVNITDGDATAGTANGTDFGNVLVNSTSVKTYVISNRGAGTLSVPSIAISGTNASEFTLYGAPSFPLTIAAGGNQSFQVQFKPTAVGTRKATVTVNNNDGDEAAYDFALEGFGFATTGVGNVVSASELKLFPNPTGDQATVAITLTTGAHISISVSDVSGREVLAVDKNMQAGENMINLNTSDLKSGMYFVKVSDDNSTTNLKMVVVH